MPISSSTARRYLFFRFPPRSTPFPSSLLYSSLCPRSSWHHSFSQTPLPPSGVTPFSPPLRACPCPSVRRARPPSVSGQIFPADVIVPVSKEQARLPVPFDGIDGHPLRSPAPSFLARAKKKQETRNAATVGIDFRTKYGHAFSRSDRCCALFTAIKGNVYDAGFRATVTR